MKRNFWNEENWKGRFDGCLTSLWLLLQITTNLESSHKCILAYSGDLKSETEMLAGPHSLWRLWEGISYLPLS
jgi:hypothetical protein